MVQTRRRPLAVAEWFSLLLVFAAVVWFGILLSSPAVISEAKLLAGFVVLTTVAGAWVTFRAFRRNSERQRAAEERTRKIVVAIEESLPSAEPPLEEEIAEVAASLARTVNRLRQISHKADAFEAEVKDLVVRGETAREMAAMHEPAARKIGLHLGSQIETHLREEIHELTVEHKSQIEDLRRSGNKTAIWTFAIGAVVGVLGNVAVALIMD